MKTVLIASITLALSTAALAQTTAIYKLVDDSGRVTYSNKPMKGASLMELDPISTIPTPAEVILAARAIPLLKTSAPAAAAGAAPATAQAHPAVAVVTPVHPTLA